MVQKRNIDAVINSLHNYTLIDVRTPLEFSKGHIPGAYNIPLLTNEDRVLVGTSYKQQGRQAAIKLGFELVGSKWKHFIEQAEALEEGKPFLVHCWRGGMRSGSMAWAFDLYGLHVETLIGGYKAYRNALPSSFEKTYNLRILSGKTGSGKTRILHALKQHGEQVLDLEDLAQHQGSSFGSMGKLIQPSQEQFENDLHRELVQMDAEKPIWVESESILIGLRTIPKSFFQQMEHAKTIDLVIPREKRLDYLTADYGVLDKEFLKFAVLAISKRLGPEQTKEALLAIRENRMRDFVDWVLTYYDKLYQKSVEKREPTKVIQMPFEEIKVNEIAETISTLK